MPSFLDRLLGRPEPVQRTYKAVTNVGPWQGIPLTSMRDTPQAKAAAYLRAYKVGWFYKAGSKISADVANLPLVVSDGDAEAGSTEATIDEPDLDIPFAQLDPIGQFQRLMEAPVRDPKSGRILVTGRQLRQKTQIRLDFGGAAFWYLEGGEGGALPTAIYGISPARMDPSFGRDGQLIGWVMDKDAPSGGTPFDLDEILVFSTATSDDQDWFGTSVVEAVYAQVPLTELMAKHTADVLTTGGRLAGMLSPKDRAMSEDEFNDAIRAWRNVESSGNAARRMLLFPEPMEYTAGASTPAEIGIPELATLNRDEILTAFPISPYRLGVPTPGGLNSGEVRREDRRDYWEDTIKPRAALFDEVLKVGLLSRYEQAMGQTFNVESEIPNLDDAATLTAKAEAYKGLVAIGLDPKEALSAVGLDQIKWLGLPDLLDPAKQAQAQEQARQDSLDALTSRPATQPKPAAPPPAKSKKDELRDEAADLASAILNEFFDGQRERVESRLREMFPAGKRHKTIPDDWWDGKTEDDALEAAMRSLYLRIGRSSLQVVADQLERIVMPQQVKRILADLLSNGGARIVDINERTHDAIALELSEGIRRGYSINQLIDGVPAEQYKGVTGAALDNGVPVWSDARAETIARTETALSQNRAALSSYDEFGISEVDAIDGDEDPECAERNGQRFSLEDALAIEDHPNGTLDWIPVIPEKSKHNGELIVMAEALKALAERPEPHAPEVNVHLPEVRVPMPDVDMEPVIKALQDASRPDLEPVIAAIKEAAENQKAPIVNVEAPLVKVSPPEVNVNVDSVRVVELPKRTHRIVRDRAGKPTHSEETDAE